MSEEYAVELRDVIKKYGSIRAVDHVTLKIPDGEFFSLLGPSGCGKTTTLRLIAGFELPTQGQIFIGGEMQGYLPAHRRPVNTVFQHYALFPHMNVHENVAFGLEMQKVPKDEIKERVAEALDMLHLGAMASRRPKQLSGGQQQRVALARALVNHPKVLLLDEPLGALDLKLRKAMQVELKALQLRVGITFIYVTHDQEEALTMSDRIAVMHQGKLLQVGTAQEIYEAPQSRFVSDFIGETNYLDGRVITIEDEHVQIAVGERDRIIARSTPGLQPGDRVSIAIRPEKMYLNRSLQENMNQIEGAVENIVYTGSTTAYHIEAPGDTLIFVRQQNVEATLEERIHVGDRVAVSWPIESSKAFTE